MWKWTLIASALIKSNFIAFLPSSLTLISFSHFTLPIFIDLIHLLSHCRSSKSLLANVLDIDDDFRCNHRCNTLPHNPTYYRTVYRQGDDGSLGPIGGGAPGRLHETVSHTCLSSSAEYELALILKELRVITDTVEKRSIKYWKRKRLKFYNS